jgi:Uma2 family endonuclease
MSTANIAPPTSSNSSMSLSNGSITANDFFQFHQNDNLELVRGRIEELSMPQGFHGSICARLVIAIGIYLNDRDIGQVISNDSFIRFQRDPDTVYGPDMAFFSYDRIPKDAFPIGLLEVIPELVVDVCSPSDSWAKLMDKVDDYLKAGVTVAIVVNPEKKAVHVYRANAVEQRFNIDDEITIPEVLPGFTMQVTKLFPITSNEKE